MRVFRSELESSISERMVLWVAKVIHSDRETVCSVIDDPRSRRVFFRGRLEAADLLEIYKCLRPGVDLQKILANNEDDDSDMGKWRRWIYDAAAWFAGDVYGYYVSQGGLMGSDDIPRVVFKRAGRVRDANQHKYVPGIETLPIRAKFRSPRQ
jgi:hypothetical protein